MLLLNTIYPLDSKGSDMRYSLQVLLIGLIIILGCHYISINCYASPPAPAPYSPSPILEWSHTYGGPLDEEGRAVLQTSDGGYVIAGTTHLPTNNGSSSAFLFKTDANGTLRWIKIYNDSMNNTACYSMVNTSDGGYVLAGKSWPAGDNTSSTGEDVFLIKTGLDGDLLWQKCYGGPKNDAGESIVQADDGGYAIFGYTESFGNGGKDAYLIKTDANGNLQWNETFGSKKDDTGYYILKTEDGGYALTGKIMSDATRLESNRFVYLIKTSANGTIQEEIKYTEPDSTVCYSILKGSDKVLMDIESEADNYRVALTQDNGARPLGISYASFDEYGYAQARVKDNGIVIVGYTESKGYGKKDASIIRVYLADVLTFYGGLQWEQTYGGENDDVCYSVFTTGDGGQILVGSTDSFGNGGSDVYLIKIGYSPVDEKNVTSWSRPGINSVLDNPQNTNWLASSSTPVPLTPGPSAVPVPDVSYIFIPIIFLCIASMLKKR
jgi:hypothetical protein